MNDLSDLKYFKDFDLLSPIQLKKQLDWIYKVKDPEYIPLQNLCLKCFNFFKDRCEEPDNLHHVLDYIQSLSGMSIEDLKCEVERYKKLFISMIVSVLCSEVYRTDESVDSICDTLSEVLGLCDE